MAFYRCVPFKRSSDDLRIPKDGLYLWFHPQPSWNTEKPETISDMTGNHLFTVDSADWDGVSYGVIQNGMLSVSKDNSITANAILKTLNQGFTVVLTFALSKLDLYKKYINNFETEQLAFIYGYKTHKIEFFNWSKALETAIFSEFSETEVIDTEKHFVALSYDANTGNTLFIFDGNIKENYFDKIVFHIEGLMRIAYKASGIYIGDYLFYDRPLSAEEIDIVKNYTFRR